MGRDKALVPYGGTAMSALVASTLRGAGCVPVVAVGGDERALTALGIEVLPDGWPGDGPLGGVVTALEHFPDADAVVVVACDLPLLTVATVRALVAGLDEARSALATVAFTDRVQPLCVAWRPAASPFLRGALLAGTRRVQDVLARMPTVEVSVDRQDLSNMNTPSDLPK